MSDAQAPAANNAAPIQEASVDNSNPEALENQVDSSQVEGQEAAPKAEEPPKSSKRKLKLKVDGREEDFEFDPDNVEEMTRHFQMSKMSQKRAKEAAELRDQVDRIGEYLEQAKGDKKKLRALIKELGADEKELAAMIIEEEIANSQKSPEMLAKEQLEEELKELKNQREKEKKDWEAREKERLLGQEMERYDMLVSKAIESSDLPKSPYVVKKMADYMMLGLENGIDLHPDDVIALVKEEVQADLQELVRAMGADKAEQFLGKEILGSIRKKNVAKAKAGQPPVPMKSSIQDVGGKKAEEAPAEKKTFKAFFGV